MMGDQTVEYKLIDERTVDKQVNCFLARKIIKNVKIFKPKDFKEPWAKIFAHDIGHGYAHCKIVAEYIDKILNTSTDCDLQKYKCLLIDMAYCHDAYSHRDRNDHEKKAFEQLADWYESQKNPHESIMRQVSQRHFPKHAWKDTDQEDLVTKIIKLFHDADRLSEATGIKRLKEINENAGRIFYDPMLSLYDRIAVIEERRTRIINTQCGIRGNDTLTLILYSLLTDMKSASYNLIGEKLKEILGDETEKVSKELSNIIEETKNKEIKFVLNAVIKGLPNTYEFGKDIIKKAIELLKDKT